jgi:hypothetical protein
MLLDHQERKAKLEKELSETDRTRLVKIATLLQSLKPEEADYLRFKLLASVEVEPLQ